MSSLSSQILVNPQDLFTSSSTQGTKLGATATTGDGRHFRYVLAGGTSLVPGKLYQSSAEDTTNYQNLAPTATSIGATSITTSTTVTVAANALTGGYVVVTVTPGQGYAYEIAGNPAASAAALTINLVDPIQVALTTSSRIDVIPNPYTGVILNPTTATSAAKGVAVYPVTNAQYGWIQVAGAAPVLAQGAVVVGSQVAASSTTAGAVVATSGVLANVGVALTGIASTEYGMVDLHLF